MWFNNFLVYVVTVSILKKEWRQKFWLRQNELLFSVQLLLPFSPLLPEWD
jgi:hypothetical protein